MGCIVCDKVREKKAVFIYEDELSVAILPAKPAVPGHIKILPKAHAERLEDLPDSAVERVMALASFSSAAAFDILKAQGTNILMSESDNHLTFDIIPRKEGDGLDFTWKPKESSTDELDAVHAKVSDKAFGIGKTEKKPEILELPLAREEASEPPETKPGAGSSQAEESEEPVNYQLKNLERLP